MKKFTKLLGIVLIIALVMSMGTMALADDSAPTDPNPVDPAATAPVDSTSDGNYVASGTDKFTITIPKTVTDKANEVDHSYAAFQIFTGDLSVKTESGTKTKTLSNINWGSGVNSNGLAAALAADETLAALGIKDNMTAAEIAEKLDDQVFDSNAARAFAAVVGAHLSTTSYPSSVSGDNYVIGNLPVGYYLVEDVDTKQGEDAESNQENYAKTRYMLEVVGNVTAAPKQDVPTFDKDIVTTVNNSKTGTETNVEATDYNIGDIVTYELRGTLPSNYAVFSTYKYVFHDTMSKGQAYQNDLKVYLGSVADDNILTPASVTPNTASDGKNATEITVTFANLKIAKTPAGAAATNESTIIVRYTAKLTEDAEIGATGNKNEGYLEFSNNPNGTGEGKTVKDYTLVFTYELDNKKIDGDAKHGEKVTDQATLDALKEKASGVVIDGVTYLKDGDDWYVAKKLAGAQFVLKATDGEHSGKYVQIDAATGKVTGWLEAKPAEVATVPSTGNTGVLVSDASGLFKVIGLDAGKYELEEIKAPAGYNLLASAIQLEITSTIKGSATATHDKDTPELTALNLAVKVGDTTTNSEGVLSTGVVGTDVVNNSGAVLPSTGGIGTTIFYVVGSILVVAAGVLLITKKRMSREG